MAPQIILVYPSRLCLVEIFNELGKTLWSALFRAGVPPMRPRKVLIHHRRAREDDVRPLGDDIGEDLKGDRPSVHGQARVQTMRGLRREEVRISGT